jgi:hypothetical protein
MSFYLTILLLKYSCSSHVVKGDSAAKGIPLQYGTLTEERGKNSEEAKIAEGLERYSSSLTDY